MKTARTYLLIILSAAAMALNYEILILSNQFAPAGINGIATMVQYMFNFSVGYMSLLINIPLAILCAVFVDRRFALRTMTFALAFSGVLLIFQNGVIDVSRFVYHTEDGRSTLLAPVASGVINGFIYSVTLRCGASTGGTDFVAAFIRKTRPDFSMMHIIFTLNSIVAVLSYFVYDFNIEPVLLCIVYCFMTTAMSDKVMRGVREAYRVELITSHPKEITEIAVTQLHHSATILEAKGGYTGKDRTLMIVVINKHQLARFMELIGKYDGTFACVSTVSDTVGNFKKIARN